MTKAIAVVTCAIFAAACGGSDKPAQDPSTSAVVTMPQPASTGPAVTPDTTPATTTDTSTSTSTPMGSTTPSGTMTTPAAAAGSNTTNTASNTNTPMNATTPSTSGATGTSNPGSADGTKNADNTKINDRDRHGALTPMDQGGSAAERNITAAVRKSVVGDKTLSFTAKNVKIITVGSKVTLRGPVKSDQERAAIEAFAKQTAGVTEVDNQLEVKK